MLCQITQIQSWMTCNEMGASHKKITTWRQWGAEIDSRTQTRVPKLVNTFRFNFRGFVLGEQELHQDGQLNPHVNSTKMCNFPSKICSKVSPEVISYAASYGTRCFPTHTRPSTHLSRLQWIWNGFVCLCGIDWTINDKAFALKHPSNTKQNNGLIHTATFIMEKWTWKDVGGIETDYWRSHKERSTPLGNVVAHSFQAQQKTHNTNSPAKRHLLQCCTTWVWRSPRSPYLRRSFIAGSENLLRDMVSELAQSRHDAVLPAGLGRFGIFPGPAALREYVNWTPNQMAPKLFQILLQERLDTSHVMEFEVSKSFVWLSWWDAASKSGCLTSLHQHQAAMQHRLANFAVVSRHSKHMERTVQEGLSLIGYFLLGRWQEAVEDRNPRIFTKCADTCQWHLSVVYCSPTLPQCWSITHKPIHLASTLRKPEWENPGQGINYVLCPVPVELRNEVCDERCERDLPRCEKLQT